MNHILDGVVTQTPTRGTGCHLMALANRMPTITLHNYLKEIEVVVSTELRSVIRVKGESFTIIVDE